MSSEFGAKFDDMSDWMVDASFFCCAGIWHESGHGAAVSGSGLVVQRQQGAFIDYVVDLFYHAKNEEEEDSMSREEVAAEGKKTGRHSGLGYLCFS